jgi:hypothetical protein
MLALERDEVDEHVGAAAERITKRLRVIAVDPNVLCSRRNLSFAAAGNDDLPAAISEARDQAPAGLAAAADEEGTPRHCADDSSVIS